MSLSCSCNTDAEWYYRPAKDFSILDTKRGRRCCSCNTLIKVGSIVSKHICYRPPCSDIEERIHGDEVYLADKYHCEECAEIEFSLEDLGFCITLESNMKEMLQDYQEYYVKKDK